ncbi:MAG: nitroreductase family protein [Clostridiales bacterium]|jgi:nitroreductase|nr:nitroreductase family protein [Eubacteriales bacterium]MDH7567617.1 nitroreductase family protein [Clostridiales bacterium]
MNDVLKCIMSRRSIRAYKPEQIKEEELQAIVQAGLYAPSAGNQQSWHFTVIQNPGVIDKITRTLKAAFLKSDNERFRQMAANEKFSVFYNAPTVIIVSGDEKAMMPQQDSAAAVENMLLAAASLNIGSCWIGMTGFLFSTEEGKALTKELGIPEGYKPLNTIVLGYKAAADPSPAPRKENLVNYIK